MVWTKSEMKMISKLFEPLQKFTLQDFLTTQQLKAIEMYPAAAANLQNKAWNLPKVRTRNNKQYIYAIASAHGIMLMASWYHAHGITCPWYHPWYHGKCVIINLFIGSHVSYLFPSIMPFGYGRRIQIVERYHSSNALAFECQFQIGVLVYCRN